MLELLAFNRDDRDRDFILYGSLPPFILHLSLKDFRILLRWLARAFRKRINIGGAYTIYPFLLSRG
mgnify:FL=1